MKTRILTIFAAAALIVCLFAGCGKKAEPEPTPEPSPTPTVDPHAGQIQVPDGGGGSIWVDEAHTMSVFPLERYSFSVTDGIASYAGDDATLLLGVDVSEYQKQIDWQAVAASGIDFAMIRVGWRGYGGGSLNADQTYRENIEGARAAGLRVGAYFFSQAVSVMEAAEEAVFTAHLLEGISLDLPVFFDWEIIGTEPARTDDVDARTVTDCCLEFCRLLESEGIAAGVYTYVPIVYYKYILDDISGLTIWMGDPGNQPVFYYDHDIWQYSFAGSVPGIEGDTDMNGMYVRSAAAETEAAG